MRRGTRAKNMIIALDFISMSWKSGKNARSPARINKLLLDKT